jgi:AcrR family transcriptional regulator
VDKEARRAELVSAAASVFADRGAANATVSDIVAEAGVAQGTFYLYFASKDDVILAVAERAVDVIIDSATLEATRPDATAAARLRALSSGLGSADASPVTAELVEILHRPENRLLHDRLTERFVPRLVPLVESIIGQGVEEGVFDVADTHAAAWFVLGGLQSVELAGTPAAEMPEALGAAAELALRALGHEGRST